MASIQDIKQLLTDKFLSDSTVQAMYEVDSNKTFDEQFSKVSIENIIFYVVAYVLWLREAALEAWRSDVESAAAANRYGTKEWWHAKVKAWQDGDMVEVLDGVVAYPVVDETKQKITFVALVEEGRGLYCKVAQGSVGAMAPLSELEVVRLQSYVDDIKPVGLRVLAQSYDGDIISMPNLEVFYDGERDNTAVESEVIAAINSYLGSVSFGGKIYKNELQKAIAAVSGVSDVVMNDVLVRGAGEINDIVVDRFFTPKAGWAKVGNIIVVTYIDNK